MRLPRLWFVYVVLMHLSWCSRIIRERSGLPEKTARWSSVLQMERLMLHLMYRQSWNTQEMYTISETLSLQSLFRERLISMILMVTRSRKRQQRSNGMQRQQRRPVSSISWWKRSMSSRKQSVILWILLWKTEWSTLRILILQRKRLRNTARFTLLRAVLHGM